MTDRTWELAAATVEGDLPGVVSLPRHSDAGPVAVAGWRRGDLGVVMVVRRWKNGALAYDVVPFRRADGEWESAAYGGGPLDDEAPDTLDWLAQHGTEDLEMWVGAAGTTVHSLRVRTAGGDEYDHPVHHPPGLVVVGAVGPIEVVALDDRGRALGRWAH